MYIKTVWFDFTRVILSDSCVYVVNVVGRSSRFFCPSYGLITDFEEHENITYVATSEGYVYLLENYKVKKRVRVAKSWKEENLRALVKIGIGEKYVAVIYSFVRPSGDEKRGLCVYTKNLIKLACKQLSYTPKDVNVIGNTVYIKEFYTKRVRAYKIYSLF